MAVALLQMAPLCLGLRAPSQGHIRETWGWDPTELGVGTTGPWGRGLGSEFSSPSVLALVTLCQLPRGGRRGLGALGAGRGHSGHGPAKCKDKWGTVRTSWLQSPPHSAHGVVHSRAWGVQGCAHSGHSCLHGAGESDKGLDVGRAPRQCGGSSTLDFLDGQTEGPGGWDLPRPPAQARACLRPQKTGLGGPLGSCSRPEACAWRFCPPAKSSGPPPSVVQRWVLSGLSLSAQETGLWRRQLQAWPLRPCVFTEVKNSAYSWPWGVKRCDRDQG